MRRLYIALTLLAAPAAFSLEAPTPAMTLVNSSIQLGPDQSGVRKGELFIRADNFDKASFDPTKLKITDLAPARLSTVVFEAATVVSKQDAGAIWRVAVQATKWPPMSSAKGKIMLELGEKREVLDYTITDMPEAAQTITWIAPPVWHSIQSKSLPLALVVKNAPASGLRLLQVNLTRTGDPALVLNKTSFSLCSNAEGDCQPPSDVAANASSNVYLQLGDVPPGSYAGSVVVSAAQKPEGDVILVNLYNTSCRWRWFGVLFLAIGLALYFVGAVIGRFVIARNSRLQAALLVRAEVQKLQKRAEIVLRGAVAGVLEETTRRLQLIDVELSSPKLDSLLPSITDPNARMAEFKAHVETQGKKLEAYQIVVERGMPDIVAASGQVAGNPTKEKLVQVSAGRLLDFADDGLSRADLLLKIAAEIAALNTAIGSTTRAFALAQGSIDIELQRLELSTSTWSWITIAIWAVVTILTGVLAMIATKPGFGSWVDLILCLLWGVGVPVAGKQLSDLSASGLSTTLGLTFPKVS